MTNFCSDNTTGASPEILDALAKASEGQVMPYGNDDLTRRVEARFRELFETDCMVFPVATGTAARPRRTSTSMNAARPSSSPAAPSWWRWRAPTAS